MEKVTEEEYICITENHYAIHLKLTQHCKSTVFQFKKRWDAHVQKMKTTKFKVIIQNSNRRENTKS